MQARAGLAPIVALVVIGAMWGLTIPLSKIAVSEGYRSFGLIFWQLVLSGAFLSVVSVIRRKGLPMGRVHLRFYLIIALLGTVLPNTTSYIAAAELPAGVMAILISTVPMFAFPIALGLGIDRFSWRRVAGLSLGLAGVILLVAPEASLPERAMVLFVPVALVAPFFYGIEGNVVSKWGTQGLDAIQVLLGASLVGAVVALPLAVLTGQFISPLPPYGAPDLAVVISAVIHALAYSGYVWLVGRAGSVFAAQVAYLVTGFGVIWAMVILNETYSGYIWAAFALMLWGIALVQPRGRNSLAALRALRKNGAKDQSGAD